MIGLRLPKWVHSFVIDDFTGAATGSQLQDHVGARGASWRRHALFNSTMLIDSQQRVYNRDFPTAFYLAQGRPRHADYEVQSGDVRFYPGRNCDFSLVARMDPLVYDCYFAGWTDQPACWQLKRVRAGVSTTLAALVAASPVGVHRLRLRVLEDRASFYVNDVLTLDAVDPAPVVLPGLAGVGQTNFAGGWAGPGDAAGIHCGAFRATYLHR